MIYDSYKPLKVRKQFERPAQAEIDAFADLPSSFVADAQNGDGALDYRIRPLRDTMRFAGPAITARLGARDSLALMPAIALARPGDVLVVATNAFHGAASIGDNAAGLAANNGIAAIVTDGLVRDIDGILAAGIPVFCQGASPNSPYRTGPGAVGLPVTIGGRTVDAGDLLVGDSTGIVHVPRAGLADVMAAMDTVRAQEGEMQAKIRDGLKQPGWVADYLASDSVEYVD